MSSNTQTSRATPTRPLDALAAIFEVGHGEHRPLRAMEGLRGFAVFLVFLVHYVTLAEPWLSAGSATAATADVLRRLGNAGVDLFFVLSGYLIYGTLIAKPRPFLRYFARRIERIYPTFLAVFAVYLLLSWLAPAFSKIPPGRFEGFVYLLQNVLLLPGLFPINPLITVAWSLSYEMFFYLAIPSLITMLRLRSWSRSLRIAFFVAMALIIFAYCARYGGPVRLAMFVAGILVYEILESGRGPRLDITGLAALALGLVSVSALRRYEVYGVPHFIVLFVAYFLVCYACFGGAGIANSVFRWTPLRWFGNMSYSYFLIHGLVLRVAAEGLSIVHPAIAQETWLFWVMLPPLFVLSLIPAAALFIVIEKPYSLGGRRAAPRVPIK